MKPHLNLAETHTPDGAHLTLQAHDGSFSLRVNGRTMMHSSATASELALGELATARLSSQTAPSILIGGLGLGFTLKSVLEKAGAGTTVHVAELIPEVVEWNRTFMAGLNGALLDDPRVTVLVEDVSAVLGRAAEAPYDAILLDIDNGPAAMVQAGNAALYTARGIGRIAAALKPGGRAAIWSAGMDFAFAARLKAAGFTVEAVPAKLHAGAKHCAHIIFVADKAG